MRTRDFKLFVVVFASQFVLWLCVGLIATHWWPAGAPRWTGELIFASLLLIPAIGYFFVIYQTPVCARIPMIRRVFLAVFLSGLSSAVSTFTILALFGILGLINYKDYVV
jgi:hypothetical protein